jgi:cobalt-zinc-cadmium resistance protein CzcA
LSFLTAFSTRVQVQINAEVPSLAPEEAERLVTIPMEVEMSGLPGLAERRSLTKSGLSQVTLVFEDGTDIYRARQLVAERLQGLLPRLAPGCEARMAPITTGLGEVLMWTVDFKPFDAKAARAGKPGWQPDGAYLTPEGDRLASPQAQAASQAIFDGAMP